MKASLRLKFSEHKYCSCCEWMDMVSWETDMFVLAVQISWKIVFRRFLYLVWSFLVLGGVSDVRNRWIEGRYKM